MSTLNTYHTLNDYRINPEPVYENHSQSKLGAGALILAIFLSVAAYFFYSANRGDNDTSPAAGDTNYQTPAATESTAPATTMDNAAIPDASSTAPALPPPEATAPSASAQQPLVDRPITEKKSSATPVQPAQRSKQQTKPLSKSASERTAPSTDNTTVTPEMTAPEPTAPQQPATDASPAPAMTPFNTPTDVVPDSAVNPSTAG